MKIQYRRTNLIAGLALSMLATSGAVLAQAPAPSLPPLPGSVPAAPSAPVDRPLPATPATPAIPQGGQRSATGSVASPFATIDANADGRLSPNEVKGNARLSGQFRPMDTNKDGYLSPSEYSAAATVNDGSKKAK